MIRTWIRLFGLVALVLSLVLIARPAAASCTATAGTWDDQSACVVYSGSGWVHLGGQPTSIYFGGTTSYSNGVYGDGVAITFQGNSITYCGHKGPQRGNVTFVLTHPLGAELLGSVNFYAATFQQDETCITYPEAAGTFNAYNWNGGNKHIDVDYFIVN